MRPYPGALQRNRREIMPENDTTKKTTTKTVVFCGGSKGGIGKSLMAGSMTDCLLEHKIDVALIDADKANPDAALWCGPLSKERHFKIPLLDEWDPLLDKIPEVEAGVVIVNMGAGDAPLFVEQGGMLRRVAKEEGWRLVLGYLLSPTFGSIRPLFQVAGAIRPWAELCVLKNQYFPAEHLVLWEEMTLKDKNTVVSKDVRGRGITELDFPLLPGRVLLHAHRPGFKGLLEAQRSAHGAKRVRVEDYRDQILYVARAMKLGESLPEARYKPAPPRKSASPAEEE